MAKQGRRVWHEPGALEYRECVADELTTKGPASFPRRVRLRPGETVLFSWIVYWSRAQRDRVNARVMKDPRILRMKHSKNMPFDVRRMSYGGSRVVVDQG
jgi:uncharacterized protein YbaA (DUF1428 family)